MLSWEQNRISGPPPQHLGKCHQVYILIRNDKTKNQKLKVKIIECVWVLNMKIEKFVLKLFLDLTKWLSNFPQISAFEFAKLSLFPGPPPLLKKIPNYNLGIFP